MICVSLCDCGELSVVELPCEARFCLCGECAIV